MPLPLPQSLPLTSVLVVEDESLMAALLCTWVRGLYPHIDCRHVGTLAEAVATWEERGCDIIIFDLLLPDSKDCSAIEKLSILTFGQPIIAISGEGKKIAPGRCVKIEALLYGAQEFVSKGTNMKTELLDAIEKAWARYQYIQRSHRGPV